jgi:O-methyltransferase
MRFAQLRHSIRKVLNTIGYDVVRYSEKKLWPTASPVSQTYYELVSSYHAMYNKAQVATQMTATDNPLRRLRHYTLQGLLRNIDLRDGDVCECGCFRGLSAFQIAHYIKQSDEKVCFHIFDSFKGLSELTNVDIPKDRSQDPVHLRKQFAASLDTVRRNLREFAFIKYYQGWIPSRFSEIQDKSFCFVHIDVDLYQPTYDSFQFFYSRLVKHGIMVFDDYGATQFPGAKKAVDECMKPLNDFFLDLPSGQAFLIKK